MNLLPIFAQSHKDIAPLLNRVHHCNALELLARLPDESVDLIAVDPPYGIQYKTSYVKYSDDSFGDDILNIDWLADAYRVLKDTGAFYMCTRWDVLHHWYPELINVGFKVKQRIVWDKGNWSAGDLQYFGSQTEDILFAIKGNHQLNWMGRESNIWKINRATRFQLRVVVNPYANPDEDHPTRKPIELMAKMIHLSCPVDGVVLDCFAGSGTTLVAARNLNRRFIGCDLEQKYVDIARRRLAQPYTPDMFAFAATG